MKEQLEDLQSSEIGANFRATWILTRAKRQELATTNFTLESNKSKNKLPGNHRKNKT